MLFPLCFTLSSISLRWAEGEKVALRQTNSSSCTSSNVSIAWEGVEGGRGEWRGEGRGREGVEGSEWRGREGGNRE